METFIIVFGFGLSLVAAVCDARTGRIPNALTLPALSLAILLGPFAGGWSGFLHAILGMFVCAAIPLLMFTKCAMGGGDVKLFAALGALLGPAFGLEVQLVSFVIAAITGLSFLAYAGVLVRSLGNVLRTACNPFLPIERRRSVDPEYRTTIRLGVPIFLGFVLVVLVRLPIGGGG